MWKYRIVKPLSLAAAGSFLASKRTVTVAAKDEERESASHVEALLQTTRMAMEELNSSFSQLCKLQYKSMNTSLKSAEDQLSLQWALFQKLEEVEQIIQNVEVTLEASQNSAACLEDLEGVEALQDRAEKLQSIKRKLSALIDLRNDSIPKDALGAFEDDSFSSLELDNVVCSMFFYKNKLKKQLDELKSGENDYIERHRSANLPAAQARVKAEYDLKLTQLEKRFDESVKALYEEVKEEFEEELGEKFLENLKERIECLNSQLELQRAQFSQELEEKMNADLEIVAMKNLQLKLSVLGESEKLSAALESAAAEDAAAKEKYLPASEVWLSELNSTQRHVYLQRLLRELSDLEEKLLNSSLPSISVAPCLGYRLSEVFSISEVTDRVSLQRKSVFNPISTESKEVVEKMASLAREKGLINAENHGILADNLSFLRSKFYSWSKPAEMSEYSQKSGFSEVDQLLSGFLFALQKDDVERAVKIMNQSSGELRRIFQPWLDESRCYLETLQAISVAKAVLTSKVLSC